MQIEDTWLEAGFEHESRIVCEGEVQHDTVTAVKYTEQTAHTCPEYRNCHWYGCVFSPNAKEAISKCMPVLLCDKCKPIVLEVNNANNEVTNS